MSSTTLLLSLEICPATLPLTISVKLKTQNSDVSITYIPDVRGPHNTLYALSPGVEADVGAGHGPDDAHAVLPRHVGDVAQAGVIWKQRD